MAYVDKETMKVVKLEGNPHHPGSRGKNCAKGPATINQINDPNRILYPLKRVGPRGSGKFERTSWDEVLDVLAASIEDEEHNTTRFVVLTRDGEWAKQGEGPIITSFIFRVRNVPAALYKSLGGFATNGTNMTKLESYQLGGKFFATQFYADVEGHPDDHDLALALEELGFVRHVNQPIRVIGDTMLLRKYNKLMAFELSSGKLKWEIGGSVEEGLPLAGYFFLGPPLVLGKQLFVLAELNGEVVMARNANVLITSFHPELAENNNVHNYFLKQFVLREEVAA